MIIVKGSTKKGQELLARGERYDGTELSDCYSSCSTEKKYSFAVCYSEYKNTDEHYDFHICSHNTNFYSVCWFGKYDGENAFYLKTGKNNYVVLLDK